MMIVIMMTTINIYYDDNDDHDDTDDSDDNGDGDHVTGYCSWEV